MNREAELKRPSRVACSVLLGSIFPSLLNESIYRLKNYMAWLSLLPIFIGQFGNVVCQGAEFTAGAKNTPGALNAFYESGNPVREPMLNEWTMRPLAILGDVHRNLRTPLTDKSQKITPAAGSVAAVSEKKGNDGAGGPAAQKAANKCSWVEHFWWGFLFGIPGGILGSIITLAMLPNVQAHPTAAECDGGRD